MTQKHKRRYKRETADRVFREFLDRIEIVNTDDHYIWGIDKVVVFGSFLGASPTVGDIDIAINLIRKIDDNDARVQASRLRCREAERNGRIFRDNFSRVTWAEDEIKLFLKNRSQIISIHSYFIERDILEKPETKTSTYYFDVKKINSTDEDEK